jgi:hypothetical protein
MSESPVAGTVPLSSHEVCFFTVGTHFYQNFVPAYVWFAQESNPGAACEIVVDDLPLFELRHGPALELLRERGEVVMRGIPPLRRAPQMDNTYRFILDPLTKREFTYIGDIDILMLENAADAHRQVFEAGYSYSNIVRPQSQKLSGLHFTRTADQYPLPQMSPLIKKFPNDEDLLYALIESQGRLFRDERFAVFRPTLGIHLSLNRLPFNSPARPGYELTSSYLTTLKKMVNSADFANLYAVCSDDARGPLKTAIGLSEMWSAMGSTPIPDWQAYVRDI